MERKNFILIMVALILCAFVLLIVQVCRNGVIKKSVDVNGINGGVKYSTSVIPKNVLWYLQTQNDIASAKGDKKAVIYYTGKDCTFAKDLVDAVEPLKDDEEFNSVYYFHPEAASVTKAFPTQQGLIAYIDFKNMCGEFCIMSAKKNQILKIEDMNLQKAEKAPEILKQFKDW